MTDLEYINSGCENRHCYFTMADGREVTGVVTTVFMKEPNKYYLIPTQKMLEFKKYMDINDQVKMRELCEPIELKNIIDVERIERIVFSLRAEIAFQNLTFEQQNKAVALLNKIVDNPSINMTEKSVNIKDKLYYVIRLDTITRILIERKNHGVIVNDIYLKSTHG